MATKSSAAELQAKLAKSLDTANQGASAKKTTTVMTTAAVSHEDKAEAKSAGPSTDKILNGSMILAAGAGAIPLPVWDAAAIIAVQVKMLADLSALYDVPFQQNLGKSAVLSLLGGMAPGLIARGTFGIFIKILPGIGSVFGAIAQPALAAATTYAVGKVFISHLESGGTLLTFHPKDFKDAMASEMKAGMKKVSEIKL